MSLPTDEHFVAETLKLLTEATHKLDLLRELLKPATMSKARLRQAKRILGLKRDYRRLAPTSRSYV